MEPGHPPVVVVGPRGSSRGPLYRCRSRGPRGNGQVATNSWRHHGLRCFRARRKPGPFCVSAGQTRLAGSPDWTRTSNPSINSRMLCQLSYGGMLMVMFSSPQRIITLLELFQPRKSKFRKLGHTSRGLVEVSLALAFFCVAAFLIPVVVVGCAGILQVRWRR